MVPTGELQLPARPLEGEGSTPTHVGQFYENDHFLAAAGGIGNAASFLLKLPLA